MMMLRGLLQGLGPEVKLLGAGMTITDSLQFRGVVECYSAQTARSLHQTIQQGLEQDLSRISVDDINADSPAPDGDADTPRLTADRSDAENVLRKSTTVNLTKGDTRIEIVSSLSAAELAEFRSTLTRAALQATAGKLDDADGLAMLNSLPPENAAGSAGNVARSPGQELLPAGDGFKDSKAVISLLQARGAKVEPDSDGGHRVVIDAPDFSDGELRIVAALRGVSAVNIKNSSITDRGIAHLAGIGETLRELRLTGARITDAGLASLDAAELKALKSLHLDNSRGSAVTDDSLPHLARLTTLEVLVVSNAFISKAGAERLQSELPNCRVTVGRSSGKPAADPSAPDSP